MHTRVYLSIFIARSLGVVGADGRRSPKETCFRASSVLWHMWDTCARARRMYSSHGRKLSCVASIDNFMVESMSLIFVSTSRTLSLHSCHTEWTSSCEHTLCNNYPIVYKCSENLHINHDCVSFSFDHDQLSRNQISYPCVLNGIILVYPF